MTASLLSVSDASISYGKVEAVRSVSLDVGRNEIVTIVGANGAGKTTLLNAIMGILPQSGRIRFDGADIAGIEIEDRVAAGLSLVPEHRELFGTMSVEDNLQLGAFRNAKAALQIADRAYVMELGSFILDDAASAVAADPRVIASYLGFQNNAAASH
jgi:branched-chain amino acid transport system ATP-binding protein